MHTASSACLDLSCEANAFVYSALIELFCVQRGRWNHWCGRQYGRIARQCTCDCAQGQRRAQAIKEPDVLRAWLGCCSVGHACPLPLAARNWLHVPQGQYQPARCTRRAESGSTSSLADGRPAANFRRRAYDGTAHGVPAYELWPTARDDAWLLNAAPFAKFVLIHTQIPVRTIKQNQINFGSL